MCDSSAVVTLLWCLSVVLTDLLLVSACTLQPTGASLSTLLAYGPKQISAGDTALAFPTGGIFALAGGHWRGWAQHS